MARLVFTGFRLTRPGTDPLELPAGFAVTAVNCDLRKKSLAPLPGLGVGSVLLQPGDLRSFYEITAGHWLAWTSPVEVVELPVPAGRIAYTGDGFPKQTNPSLATSGDPATYPTQIRRFGVKRPTAPATVEINNPVGSGTVLREVSYVYTMVVVWGDPADLDEEESGPSDPTAVFSVYEGETVNLTGFAWDAGADNDYTMIRLYRLEAGNTDAEYEFLAEIPITQAEYTDNCLDDAGPDLIESTDWDCPPDDLAGLFLFGNNVLCGFAGKDLFFSPAGVYFAMPRNWAKRAQENIVAAGYFDKTVVFVTAARQYRATGTDPQYMDQDSNEYSHGCVSRSSLASYEGGVFYAARDFLVLAHAAGNTEVTVGMYTKEQWQALGPQNMHGFFVDGLYCGFFIGTAAGIVVDPVNLDVQQISFGSAVFRGGRYHRGTRTLQLLLEEGGEFAVYDWQAAPAAPLTNQYTSGPQLQPANASCSCGKVLGDFSGGATVTLSVLVDGGVKATRAIAAAGQFRLPMGCSGSQWQVALSGTARIDAVLLAGSPGELRHGQ
jgi:hypothetical protein